MAKTCPVCRLVNPNDSVQCDCGHYFDGQSFHLAAASNADTLGIDPACDSISIPHDSFFLITDRESAQERLDHEVLSHYLMALRGAVQQFGQRSAPGSGVDLQVACAVLPNGAKTIEVQTYPDTWSGADKAALEQAVHAVTAPPVERGPVAFAIRTSLWGGSKRQDPFFCKPFAIKFVGRVGPIDEILMEMAGSPATGNASDGHEPEGSPAPWWRRFARWLINCRPRSRKTPERPAVPHKTDSAQFYSAEQLDQWIRSHPDDPQLYFIRAQLAYEQRDYPRAIADCTKVIELQPENAHAYRARGDVHFAAGDRQKSLADFNEALRLDPFDVGTLNGRGQLYLDLGAPDQAIADFTMAIKFEKRNPTLHVNLGRAQAAKGDQDEPLQHLTEAVRLDPHHEVAHACRAMLVLRSGRTGPEREAELEQAAADIQTALRLDPRNPAYYLARAEIRIHQGVLGPAVEDCDRALELDPDAPIGFELRGIARQLMGDNELAIADCGRAIEQGKASPAVLCARAAASAALGQSAAALADCTAAIELDPQHARAYDLRGSLHVEEHSLPEAIADFTTAIELAPDWAIPLVNRGNAYRLRDDYARAIADYDQAIEREPNLAHAFLNRALAWQDLDRFDKAAADFDTGLQLVPDYAPGLFGRAMLHLKRHDYGKALDDLNKVIRLDPQSAPAYYNRANLLLYRGDHLQAIRDFTTLIELCPSLAAAHSGRGNAWIHKGEHDKAFEDYREAIRCDPDNAEHYLCQRLVVEAAFHHEQERFDQALATAAEALQLDPECLPAYSVRAVALWYSERFVEAIEEFTKLLEKGGNSYSVYNGRGQVYIEFGEFTLALEDLNRAVELAEQESPASLAYAYSGRALAHAGLGDYEAADRDFERSVQLCGENAWVYYNQGVMYHMRGRRSEAAICFNLAMQLTEPALPPRKRARARHYMEQESPSPSV